MAKRQKKQRKESGGPKHKRLAATLVRARAERTERLGDEEVERQAAALVEQLSDAKIGRKQRASGHKSPGRGGKYKVPREVLCNAVEDLHKQHPRLTYNDVCSRVARDYGYKSTESVCRATRHLKWPDPRRARRNTK